MTDFVIAASATIVGGIIVYFLQRIIDGPIRDRLSIKKQHIETVGNERTEYIAIKTSGALSLKGRPIYIQNTGTIKSIIINEHQRDNVEIVHKSESEAVLIPKTFNDSGITFQTTASGTTTVSGTCNVRLFLDSCHSAKRLKAASILDHYPKNAKKVVPQNMHFNLDL